MKRAKSSDAPYPTEVLKIETNLNCGLMSSTNGITALKACLLLDIGEKYLTTGY
jgi:hypothetical protein